MKDLLLTLLHWAVMTATLCGPGGVRAVAGDLHHDAPSEFLAAHGESTALGIGQAKRPRAQVFPEDPILLPEIRDQIVLVAGHPASERENEEL